MQRHALKALVGLICLTISTASWANYSCAGTVSQVTINPTNGVVTAASIGPLSWPMLCSVSSTFNGIDPHACKIVYNQLVTAELTGKNVDMWFSDDTSGGTCTSHPGWQALTGWYFGPSLN